MLRGMGVNGVPNDKKKSCFDCKYCQSATSWWCKNENAINERGTSIPGVVGCPHWDGIVTKDELKEQANFFSRLFGSYKNGYIEVDLSKNDLN